MRSLPLEIVRRVRLPGYIVMTMIATMPIIELLATAFPTQLHNAAWRFSIIGVAGPTAITSLLGLFFIYVIALIAADRPILWVISGVSAAAAVLCLGCVIIFPLDALQMRGQVRPEALSRYNAATAVAMLKLAFASVVAGTLAVSAFRGSGTSRLESGREQNGASARLVVGQPPSARTGASN